MARGVREAGASGLGQWRIPVSPSLQPTPARGDPRLPDSDYRALAGRPPVPRGGAAPASTWESARRARAPRPCPGLADGGGGGRLRGAGTTFRRAPAPRPLSPRGGTLRAAPLAAGYTESCATYKSSLCGAILSLSVCGSRASPAPRAKSEGRRRRSKVRGAAPVPVKPPTQAEDGRTPAAGGTCSPEVLGRSFPYPSGAAPVPASEPNFVAGARSRWRLGAGPGAARGPGVGSGEGRVGWGRRQRRTAPGGRRAAAGPGSGRAAPSGAVGVPLSGRGRREGASERSGGQRGGRVGGGGCGFRPGLRPRLSLGEGPCASGCAGAGVGGGVGTGDSAFPASAGSWGAGAGPGTPREVLSPGSFFRA